MGEAMSSGSSAAKIDASIRKGLIVFKSGSVMKMVGSV